MRLLVLGGTRFLGRAIVDEAVSRGYDVTTFSRGVSGHPRPGAEALRGDRTSASDLRVLAHREWDAAIDTSVLAPAHVAASATVLAGQVGHYTYISSLSVYPVFGPEGVTEASPVHQCPPDATGTVETIGYGQLKAGSERAVARAMPGRNLIVRPGVIVGPHENVGRLPWWLIRCARGGTVLAPGTPAQPVQLADARDLAAWVVDNTRRRIPGTVNVPGARGSTLGDLLAACVTATRTERAGPLELRWVADDVLLHAGVRPWMELPLWTPDQPDLAGIWRASGDRALRTGIRYRPLTDTVHDTWSWLRRQAASQGKPVTQAWERPAGIGLDAEREREILASL